MMNFLKICHNCKISYQTKLFEIDICFFSRPAEIKEDEYEAFYKSISNDNSSPLAKIHFTAEGEVTFKSILYVPKISPHDMFNNYGKKTDRIKVNFQFIFLFYEYFDKFNSPSMPFLFY